jgi:DDE family transposase
VAFCAGRDQGGCGLCGSGDLGLLRARRHRLHPIALISNPRLEALAQDLLEQAKRDSEAKEQEEKVRLVSSASYRALSWERSRRVIYKAEVLEKGTNTRFVVSSRSDDPERLYNWYVRRGEAEGWG